MSARVADDRMAELLEQRDHLLASIEDLQRELEAGDLEPVDYDVLRADYAARAASVLRAIEAHEPGVEPAVARPQRRLDSVVWIVAAVVLAVIAGMVLARFVGARGANDSLTGDIRLSIRTQLFEAQEAFRTGNTQEALTLYDEVLEQQPSNVDALTYRGWLKSRTGEHEAAAVDLDEAIAFDPGHADARLFRAIVGLDTGDLATAVEQLAAFDRLEPSVVAQQLVADSGVRERLALARVQPMLAEPPVAFSQTGLSVADVTLAAEVLAVDDRLVSALALFDAILAEDPDNVEALASRGWLLARTLDDTLLGLGLDYLDRAVAIDPLDPESLVFRAFTRNQVGDVAGARADLAAFDALAERPPELVELVDEFELREVLASGSD